ncbi:phosphotransferase [Paenalkalicoccus suaedae]|uniref:Phosphotransferase n=1 Tax=Paenalkalicoccus suaedae TaxID=2592382 RepID=A0A859FAP1_9BACI|nr:phosphotransferase [Paenalkalicoccus suaedae]QKS69842.1 phosphotransferase [Paenalkalicoccus suaedae]
MKDHREEELSGGNVSNVYRVGDTVRRDLKENSSRIHSVLTHLEKKGFPYAPKFLGIDDQNREILSFIDGEAGNYPLKSYMWSDDNLAEIAKMLRRYHDAMSDFPIEEGWEPIDHTPPPFEVLCHNDFAVYNLIFHNKKPAGIIDFDVVAPGPRLWDIAYALYTCVPLSRHWHTENGETILYEPSKDAGRIRRKVQVFFDSYGMEELKEGLIEMVMLRLAGLCATMRRKADEGDAAFQKMIEERHDEHYQKDIAFIREHGTEWV